jgi:large subunit GTPase 1
MGENNVKMAITPFEKNIEVWKQLWRVIEKSDILL